MNCNQQQFLVTLFSNASQKLFLDNTIAAFTVQLAQPIELGSNDRWEVGLCELTCPPTHVGSFGNVVTVGDTNVLVYCNLISPQFVGSELVRCLRTFISPSTDCKYIFQNVYYVPVEKSVFQDIRIELLTLAGERVPFKESTTPLKVVLHFRRVSHSYDGSFQ
jgi:hypothetical protein